MDHRGEETERRRNALVKREQQQYASVVALRAEINLLAPVLSLAMETIQTIFMIYVEDMFEQLQNRRLTLFLLRLTHICRRLRYAALGFPQLWFPVSFTHGELAKLFLEYGRSSPLRISLNFNDYKPFYVPPELRQHSNRIQEIRLYTTAKQGKDLFKIVGPNLPGLVSLDVFYDTDPEEDFTDYGFDDDSDDDYGGGIIEMEACNLRHLKSQHASMSSFSHFKDLTHLTLASLQGKHSVQDIISLIFRSPRLCDLELSNFWELEDSGIYQDPIELPDLRRVSLSFLEDIIQISGAILPLTGSQTEVCIRESCISTFVNLKPLLELASSSLWIFRSSEELECHVRKYSESLKITTLNKSRASFTFSYPHSWINRDNDHVDPYALLDLSRVTSLVISATGHGKPGILQNFTHLRRLSVAHDGKMYHKSKRNFADILLAFPHLEDLRVAFAKSPEVNSSYWVGALQVRSQKGYARLKSFTLYVPEPKTYGPSTKIRDVAEAVDLLPYSHAEWAKEQLDAEKDWYDIED